MSHDLYEPEFKSSARSAPDPAYVADLIGVLLAQPGGLRRWSVMRAIRQRRAKTQRPVPQKFEDKVERAFRGFCADDPMKAGESKDALFYRPKDKAGEVWAVHEERARLWLNTEFSGSTSAHV